MSEEKWYSGKTMTEIDTDISDCLTRSANKLEEDPELVEVLTYLHDERQEEARKVIACLLDAAYGATSSSGDVFQFLEMLIARSVATGVFLGMIGTETMAEDKMLLEERSRPEED